MALLPLFLFSGESGRKPALLFAFIGKMTRGSKAMALLPLFLFFGGNGESVGGQKIKPPCRFTQQASKMPAALDKTVISELYHATAVLYSQIGEMFCVKKVGLKKPFRCVIMAAWNRSGEGSRAKAALLFFPAVGEERVFLNRGWGYTFLNVAEPNATACGERLYQRCCFAEYHKGNPQPLF